MELGRNWDTSIANRCQVMLTEAKTCHKPFLGLLEASKAYLASWQALVNGLRTARFAGLRNRRLQVRALLGAPRQHKDLRQFAVSPFFVGGTLLGRFDTTERERQCLPTKKNDSKRCAIVLRLFQPLPVVALPMLIHRNSWAQ